jgi:hypothetical protein
MCGYGVPEILSPSFCGDDFSAFEGGGKLLGRCVFEYNWIIILELANIERERYRFYIGYRLTYEDLV